MKNIGMLIHMSATLLKREFEREARPHGMTLLQWRVLGTLAKEGPMTQTKLGHFLEASPMTVSDVVERLETAGHVTREPDPKDSRAKLVTNTKAGAKMVKVMQTSGDEVFARALADISDDDREAMMRGLNQLVENLSAYQAMKD